ncbi:bh protein [Shimazuella alba]|jgi:ribosomal protein S27E|uniref:Bh protein n=1 Tax=Shimazuella alba TaxID=2690964 RepID=A0A6I4VV36_9BACL|nr:bh protein [Shimazuella alba]MXQ52384.1 bh protein [Shimazuella alba]
MKESQIVTEFFCIRCSSDTPHSIIYFNDSISHIHCENCGRSLDLKVDVKYELYKEIKNRLSTKPSRIIKEYKGNRSYFLKKIPRRMFKKPFRLYKEAKEVKYFIGKYVK